MECQQAKSQPKPNEDVIAEIANAIGLAEKRFHWSGAHDVILKNYDKMKRLGFGQIGY